jgi:hypothetical protein
MLRKAEAPHRAGLGGSEVKLPKHVEQMAYRDSFISSQQMADSERDRKDHKDGLRWWHDLTIPLTFAGLAFAFLALIAGAVYFLATLFG